MVRAMDWFRTNDAAGLPVTWSTRATPAFFGADHPNGICMEDAVDLASDAGCGLHINVPYGADDDYVTRLVALADQRLAAGARMNVEWQNEPWNYQFRIAGLIIAACLAAGRCTPAQADTRPGMGGGWGALLIEHCYQHNRTMKLARAAVKSSRELVQVLNCQQGTHYSNLLSVKEQPLDNYDVVMNGLYWGNDAGCAVAPYTPASLKTAWLASMNATLDRAAVVRDLAAQHGKGYGAYEGGPDFQGLGNAPGVTPAQIMAMSRSAELADIIAASYRRWSAEFPGCQWLQFNDIGRDDTQFAWGMQPDLVSPPSPRLLAFETAARTAA